MQEPWSPTAENLFLDTLEDLRRRSGLRSSQYEAIQTAGLVRRLLLDGQTLYSQANRSARLKLMFAVGSLFVGITIKGDERSWMRGWWTDAPTAQAFLSMYETKRHPGSGEPMPDGDPISRKAFLATSVAEQPGRGRKITVKDVVLVYAHKLGGVHFEGRPGDAGLMTDVLESQEEVLRETMSGIGRCVYAAMEPLALQLLMERRTDSFGLHRFRTDAEG